MIKKKPQTGPGAKGYSRLPGRNDKDYIANYDSIFGEKKFHGKDREPKK